MNWVDVAALALIAISALLGLARGFVRESLGLASWAGAAYGAYRLFPLTQPLARRWIDNTELADGVAFVVGFVALLLVFSLIANLIGRLVRVSALGGVDRALGLVFGVGRGIVLLAVAYLLGGLLVPPDNWPAPLRQARAVPSLYSVAVHMANLLPPPYRPRVAAPPTGTPTDDKPGDKPAVHATLSPGHAWREPRSVLGAG